MTGASARNWSGYGAQVEWPASAAAWQRALVSDPQTSGGLLVSCRPAAVDAVLASFRGAGFAQAAPIGALRPPDAGGDPRLAFITPGS